MTGRVAPCRAAALASFKPFMHAFASLHVLEGGVLFVLISQNIRPSLKAGHHITLKGICGGFLCKG